MNLDDFYKTNFNKLVRSSSRYLRCNYHDAEDVVSEAFVKASKGFHNYDPARGEIGAWFSRILKRAQSDYRKKIQSEFDDYLISVMSEPEELTVDDSVFDGVDNEQHKQILIRHLSHGETKAEIAYSLNIKIDTVRKIIDRFLAKVAA